MEVFTFYVYIAGTPLFANHPPHNQSCVMSSGRQKDGQGRRDDSEGHKLSGTEADVEKVSKPKVRYSFYYNNHIR